LHIARSGTTATRTPAGAVTTTTAATEPAATTTPGCETATTALSPSPGRRELSAALTRPRGRSSPAAAVPTVAASTGLSNRAICVAAATSVAAGVVRFTRRSTATGCDDHPLAEPPAPTTDIAGSTTARTTAGTRSLEVAGTAAVEPSTACLIGRRTASQGTTVLTITALPTDNYCKHLSGHDAHRGRNRRAPPGTSRSTTAAASDGLNLNLGRVIRDTVYLRSAGVFERFQPVAASELGRPPTQGDEAVTDVSALDEAD